MFTDTFTPFLNEFKALAESVLVESGGWIDFSPSSRMSIVQFCLTPKKFCSLHSRLSAGSWFFLGLRCGYCTLGSQDLSTSLQTSHSKPTSAGSQRVKLNFFFKSLFPRFSPYVQIHFWIPPGGLPVMSGSVSSASVGKNGSSSWRAGGGIQIKFLLYAFLPWRFSGSFGMLWG